MIFTIGAGTHLRDVNDWPRLTQVCRLNSIKQIRHYELPTIGPQTHCWQPWENVCNFQEWILLKSVLVP